MKSTEQIIKYIEKELKIISLENLQMEDGDTDLQIRYKDRQLGKNVAYEKLLAFITKEDKNVSSKKRDLSPVNNNNNTVIKAILDVEINRKNNS